MDLFNIWRIGLESQKQQKKELSQANDLDYFYISIEKDLKELVTTLVPEFSDDSKYSSRQVSSALTEYAIHRVKNKKQNNAILVIDDTNPRRRVKKPQ